MAVQDITVRTIEGDPFCLADMAGQVVLLATAVPSANERVLAALAAKYRTDGLALVAVGDGLEPAIQLDGDDEALSRLASALAAALAGPESDQTPTGDEPDAIFVIGRDGVPVARVSAATADEVATLLERELFASE